MKTDLTFMWVKKILKSCVKFGLNLRLSYQKEEICLMHKLEKSFYLLKNIRINSSGNGIPLKKVKQ